MCGFTGFIDADLGREESPRVALRMLDMVGHRGPDERGYYFDEHVALAAARLAIIDGPCGQQPMTDAEGRYWIAYNGEVYNYRELREDLQSLGHRFQTQSDTEVVLEAWKQWGAEAPERFNGGFAFALYDRHLRRLALARDRWGKRPLFFARVGRTLLFASEMKAFLQFPGMNLTWDAERLRTLFSLWTPLPDQTPFKGVHQLLPGSCLLWEDGRERTVRYSTATGADGGGPDYSGSPSDVAYALMSDSVRLRLRSDVPVGTYLSGGLDSAIVTRLAIEHSGSRVRTFSVAFEDENFDESEQQADVSRHLGTDHTSIRMSSQEIVEAFPQALWFGEVPVFRTAFAPMFLLSQQVRSAGLKVILTGEGADEVFLGYDIFKEALLRQKWGELSDAERLAALGRLYAYENHFDAGNSRMLARVFAEHSRSPDAPFFSHEMRLANSRFSARLIAGEPWQSDVLQSWVEAFDPGFRSRDLVGKAQQLEFITLLSGYLLSTQGDRMALAHGVENRSPFLDPRIVQWANTLPRDERLKNGVTEKWVLREAFRKLLPPAVVSASKRPYRAPDAEAFLTGMRRSDLDDLLSGSEIAQVGVLDTAFAEKLVTRSLAVPSPRLGPRDSQALLLLLSLVILDRYFVRRQFPAPARQAPLVRAHDGSAAPASNVS